MTDAEFTLKSLKWYGPQTTMQLINRSVEIRGCGLTPHSRVADLRRQGYDIRCARVGTKNGRGIFEYTLVQQSVQLELTG